MTSQVKNKWYYILNVYRLIRSEVREALRTIHELIKSTIIQVFITSCHVVKVPCLFCNIT